MPESTIFAVSKLAVLSRNTNVFGVAQDVAVLSKLIDACEVTVVIQPSCSEPNVWT